MYNVHTNTRIILSVHGQIHNCLHTSTHKYVHVQASILCINSYFLLDYEQSIFLVVGITCLPLSVSSDSVPVLSRQRRRAVATDPQNTD